MIKVTTLSGSVYTIDPVNKTWSRITGENAVTIRSKDGPYNHIHTIEVGKPMVLICPPFKEGSKLRCITTTKVVSIDSAS